MRRRPVSVWPALADLMTVLAVVGLFLALGLMPLIEDKGQLVTRLQDAEAEIRVLSIRLEEQGQTNEHLELQLEHAEQEVARNKEMFGAIQKVQTIVDEISSDQELRFSADQTLQFGDDLVEFPLNSYEVRWRPGGREKLRRFCGELTQRFEKRFATLDNLFDVFAIHVEGHTDSSQCPGDPNCNWWLSSMRAASFVALMRREELCPGGSQLDLRPIGFADTRPYSSEPSPKPRSTRRIALRIVPDYAKVFAATGVDSSL